jgi:hypothetical protein
MTLGTMYDELTPVFLWQTQQWCWGHTQRFCDSISCTNTQNKFAPDSKACARLW